MFRRFLAGVVLLLTAFFAVPAVAWGSTPYPAPPVTSSANIQVLPTSSSVHSPPASSEAVQVLPTSRSLSDDGDGLAYTGVSLNVALTIAIAAAVVLAGIVLTVLGARGALRRRAH